MIFTDYTQKSTLQNGFSQQYRVLKYTKDLIANWFADQRNIKDARLISLMYDANGKLSRDCIKIGTPFDPDGKYAGTTPAVIVSLGNVRYGDNPVNRAGNPAFDINTMQAPIAQYRFKFIPVSVHVITQSYDGTVLLAELIQLYLKMNSQAIQQDINTLSFVNVTGVTAPQAIKPGTDGNAKQLYSSNIGIETMGVLSWTTDTQGPVFNGVKVAPTFK